MKPVIALIGRPNVGKSTLFNQITKSRDALVADFAGLTRDRKYGDAIYQNKSFIVVDTGGIGENEGGIDSYMAEQSKTAIHETDMIILWSMHVQDFWHLMNRSLVNCVLWAESFPCS